MIDYPWYQFVSASDGLMQGDIISDFPVILPPSEIDENDDLKVDIIEYDVIIMSQSCDITYCKIDYVLLCPIWPLKKFVKSYSHFNNDNSKEKLRQGNVINYHMLNCCEIPGYETDFFIVDFKNIFSANLNFLAEFAKKKGERLRLLPPYREQMSQSFARSFMRVGLPSDIPSFTK